MSWRNATQANEPSSSMSMSGESALPAPSPPKRLQRQVLRRRGRHQAGQAPRRHVAAPGRVRLRPGDDGVALGADAHARAAAALAGRPGRVEVQRAGQGAPRRAVQARGAHVAARRPDGVAVLVDAHVDRDAARAAAAERRRRSGRLGPRGGRDDGRERLAARDPRDGQPAAVGRRHGRLGGAGAARELLRRLPGAVVEAREEDLRDARVALEVDEPARPVAGHVDVAERGDLGRAVDDLGGEPGGVRGGREPQREGGGEDGEGCGEAAHTEGSNRRGR